MANTFPSSGNAGVGTTTPRALFDVNGQAVIGGNAIAPQSWMTLVVGERPNADSFSSIRLAPRTTGGRGWSLDVFDNGTDASQYFQLYDQVNSAPRLLINNSGKVGIGTSTPAYPLDVAGDVKSAANLVEKFCSFTPTTVGWYRVVSAGSERVGGVLRIYTPTQYDGRYNDIEVQFAQGGYGNYGMVSQTRHLSYNSSVITQVRVSSDNGSTAYLDLYVATATSPQPIYLYGYGPGMSAFVASPVVGATAGTNPVTLALGSGLRTTSGFSGYFADSLGVGMDSPAYKLDVYEPSSDAVARFRGVASVVDLVALGGSNGAVLRLFPSTGVGGYVGTYNNGPFNLVANGSTAVTVAASGNVGIGTGSPAALLHVNGGTKLDGGLTVKVSTLSSNTTLDATYHTVLVDTSSGGTVTITLPSASSHPGREYRIKNKDKGTVMVSGTLDGKSSGLRLKMNDAATLVSDGSSWFIF